MSSYAPHRHRPTRTLLAFLALAAIVASCGGSGTEAVEATPTVAETPTQAPTATSVPPTSTPSEYTGPRSALNGMPIDAPSTTRVLGVKIDNHVEARPQTGIQKADMMVEIWVEGITRFLSLWQDSDAEVIGPIRSMRPTDFSIQNALQTTFVNSGGQRWVQDIGNKSNVQWYIEPAGTFRDSSRFAPHNLYGNTVAFRSLNTRGDYDAPLDPLWNFGPMPNSAAPAKKITTTWANNFVSTWTWNEGQWEKSTEGQPHTYIDDDGALQRVTADTIVVFEMNISNQSGGPGTKAVPVTQTTGSGPAWVFADGKMTQGTWARSTDAEWFTLTGPDGDTLTVPPGRLWLVLDRTGGVSVE